jgi:hypothetical protein
MYSDHVGGSIASSAGHGSSVLRARGVILSISPRTNAGNSNSKIQYSVAWAMNSAATPQFRRAYGRATCVGSYNHETTAAPARGASTLVRPHRRRRGGAVSWRRHLHNNVKLKFNDDAESAPRRTSRAPLKNKAHLILAGTRWMRRFGSGPASRTPSRA